MYTFFKVIPNSLLLFLFSINISMYSQNGFQAGFGFAAIDMGNSVHQTADSNYVMSGWSRPYGSGGNYFLMEVDIFQNITWAYTYSANNYYTQNVSGGTNISVNGHPTSDKGYVMAGTSSGFNGATQEYVIKTVTTGTVQWAMTYTNVPASTIDITSDEGYILGSGATLLKTDMNGAVQWAKTYSNLTNITAINSTGLTANDCWEVVHQTQTDGGYIMLGQASSGGATALLKTDGSGNVQWAKTYSSISPCFVVQTPQDGGYLLSGGNSPITKLDQNGNLLWVKKWTGPSGLSGWVEEAIPTSDGNYAFTGWNYFIVTPPATYGNYAYVVKIDPSGNLIWQRGLDLIIDENSSTENWPYRISQTLDNGYLISGNTGDIPFPAYMARTDSLGVSGCNDVVSYLSSAVAPSVIVTALTVTPTDITPTVLAVDQTDSMLVTDVSATVIPNLCHECEINISSNTTICQGNSVPLTVYNSLTGKTKYTWSPASSLSSNTGSTVIASPTITTTYTITVKPCTDTYLITVAVNPGNPVTLSPAVTICNGSSALLSAGGELSYTWQPSEGLSSTTGVNVTATPTLGTASYTVTGVSATGCIYQAITTVQVNGPTLAVSFPITICQGNSPVLSVVGGSSYIWIPSGALTSSTGTEVSASPTTSTTYTVIGFDINGCSASAVTTVGVNPVPVLAVSPAVGLCGGLSASLSCTGADSYTWSPSTGLNSTTGGSVQVSLSSGTVTYTVTGTYLATGCSKDTNITVSFYTTPTVNVGPDIYICSLTSVTVTATGSGNYTYSWNPSNYLNTTEGPVVVCTPVAAGAYSYTVTGTDGSGCSSYDGITISQVASITANAGNNATVCFGSCTTLIGSGGFSYTWNPSTGLSATNVYNPSACPGQTTTYTLVATGGIGCSANSAVTVFVYPLPSITVSPDVTLCGGTSALLSASGAVTYLWSPSTGLNSITSANVNADPAMATLYSVIGTDSNGCNSAPGVVNVTVLPVFSISPPIAVICDGSSTTLTANTTPGAATPVSFTWQPSGSLNPASGPIVNAFPTLSTSYTVTAQDANNCISQSNFTVTVDSVPVVTIAASSTTICSGTSVNITAKGAETYIWKPGTSPNTGSEVTAKPLSTTTYTVTGSDTYTQPAINACSSTTTITVKVNPPPLLTVSADQTIIIGNSTTLSVTTPQNETYQWTPDNTLSCNNCLHPTALPQQTTTYYITVTDSNGCTTRDSITITVKTICGNFYIPTAFSPNADNVNDVLQVYGLYPSCFDPNSYLLQVFDRWGNKVFGSLDPKQSWDGTYLGKMLDSDVFVYSLQVRLTDGTAINKKGNISLIR